MTSFTQSLTRNTIFTPLLSWVDCELGDLYYSHLQEQKAVDVLLELRRVFTDGESLKALVSKFYQILPELENTHYLLGYRIRQWIWVNCKVVICDPLGRVAPSEMEAEMSCRSLESYRKWFFEACDYEVPYHDIRVSVKLKKEVGEQNAITPAH